ncbi:hypothetical protein [Streptomyces acidiscabies]|uniref:Uncharacterized protein n=1 Tax=Streptomyces acidiscabies TaxID=42234 RepID=A0AAP6BJ17_9ACTN|nr:hypothetical protein [Streptomyces acidiscabies]MBP5935422.1 hypothetical protein [Streptomyces sp. LBUM 1476]MBZ3916723.1 hypothetical protein [Streptomyces acidiscabies]MDX2965640.1 hypothetical protein [Streptomyces acidiscabies]MDX3024858.1 hypothetical protein [Streptomyces acidiscabies]MDX3795556.1 hypothetical protein [Streptomyces acidiscabies]
MASTITPNTQQPLLLDAFARALATDLPGRWTTDPTTTATGPDPAGTRIWNNSPLPNSTAKAKTVHRAILTSGHGHQFYVTPRPRRPGQFLVLPMLPAGTGRRHVEGLRAPRGIAVPADPARASAAVRRRVLHDFRIASLTALRRSSPGHLQVRIDIDTRQRARIRTGYLHALFEVLDAGAVIDPATGDVRFPGTHTPEQTASALAVCLSRLHDHDYHVIVRTPTGLHSRPPARPARLPQPRRR